MILKISGNKFTPTAYTTKRIRPYKELLVKT